MNEYAPAILALLVAVSMLAMLGYQMWTEKKEKEAQS